MWGLLCISLEGGLGIVVVRECAGSWRVGAGERRGGCAGGSGWGPTACFIWCQGQPITRLFGQEYWWRCAIGEGAIASPRLLRKCAGALVPSLHSIPWLRWLAGRVSIYTFVFGAGCAVAYLHSRDCTVAYYSQQTLHSGVLSTADIAQWRIIHSRDCTVAYYSQQRLHTYIFT